MRSPDEDAPLCPEGDFRFWGAIGLLALAARVFGCLAGVASLLPDGADPTAIVRLSAAGAAVVWVALCAGAGSLAFASIALVRGRPAGSAVDIAARSLACVAVASLAGFVPLAGHPAAKAAIDGTAFALASALLARSAFRIAPLEAFAATAVGAGVVGAVSAAAFLVTWAVRP